MVSPNRRLTEEVGKGWIGEGHGDKIILSADAGAKVNKTILVESSLDRQGEDCEHEKCCNFWSISPFQLQFGFWRELAFLLVVRRIRQEVWGGILPGLRKVIWEGVVLVDKEVAVV
jgi:hypothetical protein